MNLRTEAGRRRPEHQELIHAGHGTHEILTPGRLTRLDEVPEVALVALGTFDRVLRGRVQRVDDPLGGVDLLADHEEQTTVALGTSHHRCVESRHGVRQQLRHLQCVDERLQVAVSDGAQIERLVVRTSERVDNLADVRLADVELRRGIAEVGRGHLEMAATSSEGGVTGVHDRRLDLAVTEHQLGVGTRQCARPWHSVRQADIGRWLVVDSAHRGFSFKL